MRPTHSKGDNNTSNRQSLFNEWRTNGHQIPSQNGHNASPCIPGGKTRRHVHPKQPTIHRKFTYIPDDPTLLLILNRALTLGRLGERLLPHLARRLMVEAREENAEHIRVPANGMAFDALFDVLFQKSVRVSCFVKRSGGDSPRAAPASQSCCPPGR